MDIIRADNGQYSQLDGYIIVFLVMGKSVQCIDKQSEGDSVGYGTELIEFPVGTFFFSRQVLASQYQGCKPQRDIDGKQPMPREEMITDQRSYINSLKQDKEDSEARWENKVETLSKRIETMDLKINENNRLITELKTMKCTDLICQNRKQ